VGKQLFRESLNTLTDFDPQVSGQSDSDVLVVNSLSWSRVEVVELPNNVKESQTSHNGRSLGIVRIGPMSVGTVTPELAHADTVTIKQQQDNSLVLENSHLIAHFVSNGTLVRLFSCSLILILSTHFHHIIPSFFNLSLSISISEFYCYYNSSVS
jgi:hypothetical protein